MTQLEQKLYTLAANACREYIQSKDEENKWEQRKYEIVKDTAIHLLASPGFGIDDNHITYAIRCGAVLANNIIELFNPQNKGGVKEE